MIGTSPIASTGIAESAVTSSGGGGGGGESPPTFPCEEFIPGYAVVDESIVIPIASLAPHGITPDEVHPVTGDARALAYALCAQIDAWYGGMAEADRPQACSVRMLESAVNVRARRFAGTAREVVELTTYRNRPGGAVADEPVGEP